MTLTFAADPSAAIPLTALYAEDVENWVASLPAADQAWVETCGFGGRPGETLVFPDAKGGVSQVAVGLGMTAAKKRGRFALAAARPKLPAGTYDLQPSLPDDELEEAALGWLLAGYQFDSYAKQARPVADLLPPEGVDHKKIEIIANGEALTRNLINTPTPDMGPPELEAAARAVANDHKAEIKVIVGDALLEAGFPMIHTVGRASAFEPRLIDMAWGTSGPLLTLVGKGVCFDTGGLNIKPGVSMGLMKKDMGGAATVLGLAQMIMALNSPIQLRVLIPAVENAISGNAFRPSDILWSRKGLSVEINNTDAEGRLVLADALAYADEADPDLIISMATLTGAARVAVGPDLAPFYATSPQDAADLLAAGNRVRDPVWQMPFWDPYESQIEPGIADLDNAPKGGMAGSITAALFLRRFVTETERYMHFDIYGWQPAAAPARPMGGVGQGARAVLEALPGMLNLG